MKLSIHNISHNLLISSCLLTSSFAVNAMESQSEVQLAMYVPVNGVPKQHIQTSLSPKRLLMMAESLNTGRMSTAQKNLEFALIYTAAKKGNAEAQFRLANYYIESELVTADDNEAAFWLEEAIAQGHSGAKFIYENMGIADFDVGC